VCVYACAFTYINKISSTQVLLRPVQSPQAFRGHIEVSRLLLKTFYERFLEPMLLAQVRFLVPMLLAQVGCF